MNHYITTVRGTPVSLPPRRSALARDRQRVGGQPLLPASGVFEQLVQPHRLRAAGSAVHGCEALLPAASEVAAILADLLDPEGGITKFGAAPQALALPIECYSCVDKPQQVVFAPWMHKARLYAFLSARSKIFCINIFLNCIINIYFFLNSENLILMNNLNTIDNANSDRCAARGARPSSRPRAARSARPR